MKKKSKQDAAETENIVVLDAGLTPGGGVVHCCWGPYGAIY